MSDGAAGFLVCLSICLIIGSAIIAGINESWEDDVVTHGCGEYYLDQNHYRQWRWKECGGK